MAKPVANIKSSAAPGLQIAVWENEKGYSVSIGKRFKNQAGEWVDAKSLFPSDLPALAMLCDRALVVIDKLEQLRRGKPSEPPPPPATDSPAFKDDDIPF